ncbi:MAG: hypothetical protein GY906_35090 [bacterium]|nr:hypothetical protein [bacterium]
MHIDSYRFGQIKVDGCAYSKDVILLRGEVTSPWWREGGGHVFATSDMGKLLEAAPEVVVMGTGYFGRVRVLKETIAAFAESGTEVIIERTPKSVEIFNGLSAEGRDVAAALHLTC